MNLILDVGNTRIKVAVFKQTDMLTLIFTNSDEVSKDVRKILNQFPEVGKTIISSVGKLPDTAWEMLQQKTKVLLLTNQTKVPFQNKYATPKTLGVDRIALVSAAAVQFPEKNVLVIDAGSCITYDFLTAKNEYLGGAISPGIAMRYKSLHTFTENLPLLSPRLPKNTIGNSTENSIHSGIVQGVVHEINGYIDHCREKYPDFTIILTGGDAHLLRERLKNGIFANPNFLLEGLCHILEHNEEEC